MSQKVKRKRNAVLHTVSKKRKFAGSEPEDLPEVPAVQSEVLRWKEVALPNRLDDAEGFYGLEEIEDVAVVKVENSNQVLFRPLQTESFNGTQQLGGDLEEEWIGFEDLDSEFQNGGNDQGEHGDNLAIPKASKAKNVATKSPSKTTQRFDPDLRFDMLIDEMDDAKADVSAWKNMNLSVDLLAAISRLGFSNPTPIQMSAIPPIRNGNDVIGKAVTGSGKTLAFGIPIFENWIELERNNTSSTEVYLPIALILALTRELAHQLRNHLTDLSKGLEQRPRIATVTGGLSIFKQQRQLEDADIVIGTPGRLLEVINESRGLIERLRKIKYLVVDEADRLLSEGHFKELEEIINALDREVFEEQEISQSKSPKSARQTLVFSATFHKGLQQKLASKSKKARIDNNLLSNEQSMEYLLQKLSFRSPKPTFIDSNPTSQVSSTLQEAIVECPAMEKDLYLYTILFQNPNKKVLVFTNSISAVKRITPFLQTLSIDAIALHSSMPQKSRLRSLEKFSPSLTCASTSPTTATKVLIATDVAARGLDIPK